MALGRFASAVFGLALVLGLVFGVGSLRFWVRTGITSSWGRTTSLRRSPADGSVQGAQMEVQSNNPDQTTPPYL